MTQEHHCYVVMGISSCGKSTIGKELATRLGPGVTFHEGDAYHPLGNVNKMKQGIPLGDSDRVPWLQSLHNLIKDASVSSSTCVISCSALKKEYRDILIGDVCSMTGEFVRYIWLDIDPTLAKKRCTLRGTSHFFPPSLIDNQYEILDMTTEESFCRIKIQDGDEVHDIVEQILKNIE